MRKALFIDRDGTISYPVLTERGTPRSPFLLEEFRLMPRVAETLEQIRALGILTILVTNQPDIAYGNISQDEWEKINVIVKALPLDDIFICFHTRDEGCSCKKSEPGMILEAAHKWALDLGASFVVGDSYADAEAAKNAGCKSILIDAKYNQNTKSDFRINKFSEVVNIMRA